MKKIRPFVLIALFTCPVWLQGSQITNTGSPSIISCMGYLPYPCAAQHVAVRQESALNIPINSTGAGLNMPAGTVFIDPDFGGRTLRVTDVNSIPGAGCMNSTSQNIAVVGPDNPDLSVFSSDTLWFRALDLNSNDWLFKFNPSTMQVSCAPVASTTSKALPWYGEFGRTAADVGIMFGPMSPASGTPWVVQKYDVTQYANPSNVAVTYYDFSTCSGLGWLTSLPIKTIQWFPGMWLSYDDNRIMWTFGPTQNMGWLSAIYDKTVGDCGWVDTRTGQIGGNSSIVIPGTMTGYFPLDWGSTRAPSAPTVSQTTGGSLTAGHTYDICYSLQWDSNNNGNGESSCSGIQRVAITTGNNAIGTPSPAQCATQPNCDVMTWAYYNVYANDEANCGSAECSYSQLYLQPAANLGCTQATPAFTTSNITQQGATGATTYSYAEVAYGPHCNTWTQAYITTGNATLSSSNYNIVTPVSVSGATFYNVVAGGKGNATVWSSAVYGTASVDAAAPTGGGTSMYPESIIMESSASARNDNAAGGLVYTSMGTIPCYDSMGFPPPSTGGISSTSPIYACNNNTKLTAISTSGPTAPTKSTLGLFMHAAIMGRNGNAILWGQYPVDGSNVLWQLSGNTAVLCDSTGSIEYPSGSAYPTCYGHGLAGAQGVGSNNLLTGGDPNYSYNYRTFANYNASAGNLFGITNFGALDPNGADNIDQHESGNTNQGNDATAALLISTEEGPASNTWQYPTYIGRPLMLELYTMNPSGTISRYAHHRASGFPYYTTTLCKNLTGGCEQYGWESQAAISDDGKWAMYTSDMNSSLGCDPTQSFPITAVSLGSPTTITISIPSGNAAPLGNQVGTVVGTSGVAGLNGQWTIAGTSPNFSLSGSNLTGAIGSLTGAQFQECTYNASGQVNGPAPASNCGTGSQTCKTGMALRSVFITELK